MRRQLREQLLRQTTRPAQLRRTALWLAGSLCLLFVAVASSDAISAAGETQEAELASESTVKAFFPYLVFPGTCRDAVQFYAQSLGGEVADLQTFGDSPVEVPADQRDRIFNAELKFGDHVLMACDDLPGNSVTMGNNISMFLTFETKAQKVSVFEKLAAEGKVLFPAAEKFGMLEDKYGVRWMLIHEEE